MLHWAGKLHHTLKAEKVRVPSCGAKCLIAWGLKLAASIVSRHYDRAKMLTEVRHAEEGDSPLCEARPTCHSWQKNMASFSRTACVTGFQASICSCV